MYDGTSNKADPVNGRLQPYLLPTGNRTTRDPPTFGSDLFPWPKANMAFIYPVFFDQKAKGTEKDQRDTYDHILASVVTTGDHVNRNFSFIFLILFSFCESWFLIFIYFLLFFKIPLIFFRLPSSGFFSFYFCIFRFLKNFFFSTDSLKNVSPPKQTKNFFYFYLNSSLFGP